MSATAIRVSASDLRELPIPVDVERWDDAATQLAGGASWDIFGRTACASWGLDDTTTDAVMAWWLPNVRLRDRVADDLADEPTGP